MVTLENQMQELRNNQEEYKSLRQDAKNLVACCYISQAHNEQQVTRGRRIGSDIPTSLHDFMVESPRLVRGETNQDCFRVNVLIPILDTTQLILS